MSAKEKAAIKNKMPPYIIIMNTSISNPN